MPAYITPGGEYSTLYAHMASQPHLLVAGATGSGKSVVINGIIHAILTTCSPAKAQFILIDPKRVELSAYKYLPHTLYYASEPGQPAQALRYAMQIIDDRYTLMQRAGQKKYIGPDAYVIIDELADLMLTDKKTCQPLLQRIAQIGRASKCHLLVSTQCPLATVISTPIKCNIDARVALRTRSAQDSRNILEKNGCEDLPRFGYGYYMTPEGTQKYKLPMIPEEKITALVQWWTGPECYVA